MQIVVVWVRLLGWVGVKHCEWVSEWVSDLSEGVVWVSEWVSDLSEWVSDLSKGVSDLSKGVSDLSTGVSDLSEGMSDLSEWVSGWVICVRVIWLRSEWSEWVLWVSDLSEGVSDRSEFSDLVSDLSEELSDLSEWSERVSEWSEWVLWVSDLSEGVSDLSGWVSDLSEWVIWASHNGVAESCHLGCDVTDYRYLSILWHADGPYRSVFTVQQCEKILHIFVMVVVDVLWYVTPYSLVEMDRRFRGTATLSTSWG